jgi:hypothetical protein
MKARLALLAAAGLALGGCYYAPYGAYGGYGPYYEPNVAGAALLGAGVGAVAGAAIASPGYGYYGRPYYGHRHYGHYGRRRW